MEYDLSGLPVHEGIPVNAEGDGPVFEGEYSPDFDHFACWCGQRGCTEFIRPGTIFDSSQTPYGEIGLPPGQVWAWMAGERPPFWKIVGAGAIVPDELKRVPMIEYEEPDDDITW